MFKVELFIYALFYCIIFSNAFLLKARKSTVIKSSKLRVLKYDPESFIEVSITKPLGLVLEEVVPDKNYGVYVGNCKPDGNAYATGKIYKGLLLINVNGVDVKLNDFDSIMNLLVDHPSDKPLNLVFVDPKSVMKGPATLNVKLENGKIARIDTLKGLNLRSTLQSAGIEIYGMKGKLTNCGGGGVCGTCAVEVIAKEWEERPDFESRSLKKYSPLARLSCNTIIEGDAEIIIQPKKI